SSRLGLHRRRLRWLAAIRVGFLGVGRLEIDAARHLTQLLVRLFFIHKGLPQERRRPEFSEKLGVSADAAVAGYFAVLHALSGGDQARIQFFGRETFCDHFGTLLDEALHALAFLALRAFSESTENLFEPHYVLFRLPQVLFKGLAQFRGSGCLGHLRKSFHKLV